MTDGFESLAEYAHAVEAAADAIRANGPTRYMTDHAHDTDDFHDTDTETLRAIATELGTNIGRHHAVHLLATIAGHKAGTSLIDTVPDHLGETTTDDWARTHPLVQLATSIGLPYTLSLSDTPQTARRSLHICLAHDADTLQYAPPYETPTGTSYLPEGHPEYMRDWGRFIGVPAPDNCWWYDEPWRDEMPDDHPDPETVGVPLDAFTPLFETAGFDRDLSPTEATALILVPWMPEPTVAGIERAIDAGRAYYAACASFDRHLPRDAIPNAPAVTHATRHTTLPASYTGHD